MKNTIEVDLDDILVHSDELGSIVVAKNVKEAGLFLNLQNQDISSFTMKNRLKQKGVKKLVMTHIAPYTLKKYDVEKIAKKYFKGPVIIAKDLTRVKI